MGGVASAGNGRLVLFYPVVLLILTILLYQYLFFASVVNNLWGCFVGLCPGVRSDTGKDREQR